MKEIKIAKGTKSKALIITIDLSKAFDLVNKEILIDDLKREKFDANLIN